MPTPWHYQDDTLLVRKFCVGPLENNVYVVACAQTNRAVIIDAADEAERIQAETAGLHPQAILTTHGHWDHVQAAALVSRRLGIPFGIHRADRSMVEATPELELDHRQEIAVGRLSLRVLHTPGHTPGSVCFSLPGSLFTGDTLFPGGPGATSGPGQFATIIESLENLLFPLPDATTVFPGHGLDTTLGTERPRLHEWVARGY
ncbi:MAG: MBL fold metallo-hydrolase [Actinomycetota bacterium]|nr:MBL fold metallo-hydrolase [Actinomycetota bacterium]